MNKNNKDFMNQLSDLDDFFVEEIAENYPALYGNTKKRILKKCLKKDGFSAEIESDDKESITISGTERYKRRPWYRFAASAAAFVVAVGGITSVFMLNRHLNGNDVSETEKTSVLSIHDSWTDSKTTQATVASSDKDNAFSSYDSSNANEYWVTNTDESSQTPPTVIEPTAYTGDTKKSSVNNFDNSVSQNNTPEPSFLKGLYYVEISGVSGYMGFDFNSDGTLTKYGFDDFGDVINSTIVTLNYEIVENQFSFGDLNSELNKKIGTIINNYDGSGFSVRFDDGLLYNFSTECPKFQRTSHAATKPDTLSGTIWSWYGDWDMDYNYTEHVEIRTIEFKEDGVNGTAYILLYPHDATKRVSIEIPFTYEQNGDEITFYNKVMEYSAYNMLNARLDITDVGEKVGLFVQYEADEDINEKCFALSGYLNNY